MEAKIKEESVLEFKALTMSRATFRQVRIVLQEEYTEYYLVENFDPMKVIYWKGYVVETLESSVGTIQTFWFLYEAYGTLNRIADRDLFWILRSSSLGAPDATVNLRKLLPQIFVK